MAVKKEFTVLTIEGWPETQYKGDETVEAPEVFIYAHTKEAVQLTVDEAEAVVVELQEAIAKAKGPREVVDFMAMVSGDKE